MVQFLRSGLPQNPYVPGSDRHARRQAEIDAADARAAEFQALTGRAEPTDPVALAAQIIRAGQLRRNEVSAVVIPGPPQQ
jgi:hypothetical protein